ncbi:MAG: hypothetical protein AAF633_17935 [Chloroflexota bacterium]
MTNIAESRRWFEAVAGLEHARTCAPEPHPTLKGHSLTCCYMSANEHHECLVLMEHRDGPGARCRPPNTEIFHLAFEIEENKKSDRVTPFATAVAQLRSIFEEGQLSAAAQIAHDGDRGEIALADIDVLSPVTRPIGPYIHIFEAGEAAKMHAMRIKLWVNDDLHQDAHTSDLITKTEEPRCFALNTL